MKIAVPDFIKEILKTINDYGYEGYIVGGAVRDAIIGKDNDDYDICTNMPLEEINKIFPAFKIMKENNHRNTGIIKINDKEIEISTFKGNSLNEDLSNRDFTINSLACDVDGNIIDYFNGIKDINSKRISLVNKEGLGLEIDPLRILRALRFQGKLGFTISEETKQLIEDKSYLLNTIAPERILSEFIKMLNCTNFTDIIRNNKKVLCTIIPELEDSIDFNQNNRHHIYNVFDHTMKVIDGVPKDNFELKIAALFHDLGKPKAYTEDEYGEGHFYGHNEISCRIFADFARKYRMNKDMTKKISKLIYYHDYEPSIKPVKMKKFLLEFGIEDLPLLFRLKEADIKAQNPEYIYRLAELRKKEKLYKDLINSNECLSIKNLKINGSYLKEMGFYNEEIGIVLKDVFKRIIENQLENDEDKINEYITSKYK